MSLSAKKEFLASPNAKIWTDITDTAAFKQAVLATFSEYCATVSTPDMASRIIGARDFMAALEQISTVNETSKLPNKGLSYGRKDTRNDTGSGKPA